MLIDARTLPRGHVVATDICVVGTGPAGLTLARELVGSQLRVTLLESGAEDPASTDEAVRAQFSGEVQGDGYPPVESVHSQGFGGTTAMWDFEARGLKHAVRLRRLEVADFEQRGWVPNSGWPFGYDELDPYYGRAEDAFGIGRFADDIGTDDEAASRYPLVTGDVTASEYRFVSAGDFVSDHRRAIDGSRNVEVLVNATVVELDTSDDPTTVSRAVARTAPDHEIVVQARWFVLAAGGIDNARLLLLSDQTHRAGLGNDNDLVGRYFMDHPGAFGAYLSLRDPRTSAQLATYDTTIDNGIGSLRSLTLRPEIVQREQLMHSFAVVQPRVSEQYRQAISSVRDVARLIRPGGLTCSSRPTSAQLARGLIRGVGPLALAARSGTRAMRVRPGWSQKQLPKSLYASSEMQLLFALEQAPNPESRLTLIPRRDRLGQRLVRLDYRWSDIDVDSASRTREIMSKELSAAGVGEVEIDQSRGFPDPSERSTPHHPMGTTRMHRDPRRGVVDENGRVHGISNLSIVGSSTFPTGGSANPTLTLVALAIRLADHLGRALA